MLAFVAAALGVVASLARPWFAASPAARTEEHAGLVTIDGPVDSFFGGVWRWISAADGVTASERFGGADTALMALAGLAVVAAAIASVRGAEMFGRSLMQGAALGILGLSVVKVVQIATADERVETRYGAVVAIACGAVMLVTAGHVAQQKLRKAPPPRMSALHDPTLTRPGSVAPPGS